MKRSSAAHCTLAIVPVLALLLTPFALKAQTEPTSGVDKIAVVERNFGEPPADSRIMMRWWWFGAGVVKPELEREILAMKAGGMGGFEIQPVYPLALDDESKGFVNLPYLSPGFLDDVRFAAETGRKAGMRVDMTLASGWPYGGPHVPVNQAAAHIREAAMPIAHGTASLPTLEAGEKLIAVFTGDGTVEHFDAATLHVLTTMDHGGEVRAEAGRIDGVAVFYIMARTKQKVKRPAAGAEGFVLDHFSKDAVDSHLAKVGEVLMKTFGDRPPYSVFSDSLEVYNADWTDDLLPEFKRRRGYDLTPYLPQLYSGVGKAASEVRHDWGVTLTELIDERYLTRIDNWSKEHHTLFRSQTYGAPAVNLSSNRLVALPEGEGPQWNRFSYTRLASSASHLYGRPVTSSETWTWLHSPAFRATPLDMKAEADHFFLEGVNQLIGHGWPYTPPGAPEPGWAFYAAGVFDDHNPWWMVMPEVTKYLQRVSYLMRQGKPANDIAVLLPDDDAYAEFKPGKVSLSDLMPEYVTPAVTQQILSAGYNLDYIDAEAIRLLGIQYPVLVMPHVERLSPATMEAIAAYAAKGGKVIAVGRAPSRSGGLLHAEEDSAKVAALAKTLFNGNANTRVVTEESALGAALQQALQPDMKVSESADAVGFLHRKLDDADLYFIANTSNHAVTAAATFRSTRKAESSWNPLTGEVHAVADASAPLELAPYESRVIVFSDGPKRAAAATTAGTGSVIADLTEDWKLTVPGLPVRTLETTGSWTEDPKAQFFSGQAIYTKTVRLTEAQLAGARTLTLDFGKGTAVEVDPKIKSGMRALLESPVREAAVVSVNGKRAGSVWLPPYTVDLAGLLHAGDNAIEVRVANTAINELAGRPVADYRALEAKYGQRFVPQDMDNLKPLPSGIMGTVQLLETK